MKYSRLNQDYFWARNTPSYVISETFVDFFLVDCSSHLGHEFFDLQHTSQNGAR